MKKTILLTGMLLAFLLNSIFVTAQDWVSKMKDPSVNFFEVQKDFNTYYKNAEREMERKNRRFFGKGHKDAGEEESEIPGYTQYKRWEWFMAPRVSSTGERFDPSKAWIESRKYHEQYHTANAGNWTLIGPSATQNLSGAGRLNFIRIHPNDPNTLFVGSPGGGLWKSTNGGVSWSTNTDNLSHVIGCTDIAIDPTNTDIMYLATGDGDGGDTYSVGILKTTDGGLTWNPTGLSFYMGNTRQLSKLLIDPTNTNIIIAGGSGGIYRSTDAGVTFTLVQTGGVKDMEFKPGDPTTVYACGTEFYRSTNTGQNWTKITSGLPTATNVSRMAIAVTPADANYVYLIAGLPAPGYGTQGFYKSTNGGTSFTLVGAPALGNQQWYDLCIASSPTNSQEVIIGGQTDFIRSTNAGTSWIDVGGNTHVDYHDIVFVDATTFYTTSDGGVYRTTNNGSSWTNLNHNLEISQMYGFGQSAANPDLLIQGWQDNGTNRYNGTNWSSILGGDGMLCFIDWNNDQNMWAEYYNGALQKSTNGGASFSSAVGNINEAGAWVTPWSQDPIVPGTIYSGFINLWRSINGGSSWTKLSSFTNTATVTTLTVSPANNQVIWVAKPGSLYLTTDGGATWSTITSVPSGTITGIACSNTDASKAWITYSGFTNTNKVFSTSDQGATWTNLSASLPNIPINCITYMNNSANDGVYIGTDVGIFYKDVTLNVWEPFYQGLPNVVITQLSIFYGTPTKIRASTYGRGIWESDLFVPGSYAPTAAFGSSKKISCPGASIQFNDYSAGQPTGWNWSFPGGSPSTSTQQNPLVAYNTPGTYPVSLSVTNAIGNNATTTNNYITISSSPFAAPNTQGATICGPGTVNLSATGSGNGTLRWWDAPGGGNVVATGNNFSPNIAGTTNYYVDEDFPGAGTEYSGAFSNGAGAFFTANDIRGLYFDVINPVTITSFDVYPNSSANRTIEILDAQGNTFADTTIYMTATNQTTPLTVPVNITLYPGTNYFIKCRGYVDLWRDNAGAVYPYTSSNGDLTVTGSNAGSPGYYYFFYSWAYTPIMCNTARAICTANDTCSVQGLSDLSSADMLQVFPNPNNGEFNLKFNITTTDNYTVIIANAIGETVFEEKLNNFSGTYDKKIGISKFGKGVYMLSVSNSKKEVVRKIVQY